MKTMVRSKTARPQIKVDEALKRRGLPSFKTVELLRYAALAVITALIWMVVHGKTTLASWQLPMGYAGDALYNLACIQAAQEGDFIPVGVSTITRLGAPFGGNWNDFPMYEKPVIYSLGLLARLIGLFPAGNAAVLVAHILSALSFYFCCRVLRWRWEYAWCGALLFAFAYYHGMRGFGHVFIAYSYTVPLAVLSCWLVFSSRCLRKGHFHRRLCFQIAFLLGISNPYNLGMYLQLLVLGIAAHWLARRRRENLRAGLAALAIAAAGFVLVNSGTFYVRLTTGPNPSVMVRTYEQTERFGLKPIELVVPPANHRVAAMAEIGKAYRDNSLVKGEMFSPYLGWIGLAGLLWMFGKAFMCIVRRERSPVPAAALQVVWIVAYSVVGSMNSLLALGGFALLRASNRHSIFISALVLMFLVSKASVLTRVWPRWSKLALAGACLGIGLFDQIPQSKPSANLTDVANAVALDRSFFNQLETALPPNAMVFQLPVVGFPEAAGINRLDPYTPCRGYLASTSLRFSYGSDKGRDREAWQSIVESLPVPEMVQTLESYGFSALLVHRKGYTDDSLGLAQQLIASGRTNVLLGKDEYLCVRLYPADKPRLPDAVPAFHIEYVFGWGAVEYGDFGLQRLGDGNSALRVVNDSQTTLGLRLSCQLEGVALSEIFIHTKTGQICKIDFQPGEVKPQEILFDLEPGKVRSLHFQAHPPGDRNYLTPFILRNLQVRTSKAEASTQKLEVEH